MNRGRAARFHLCAQGTCLAGFDHGEYARLTPAR
jgi:hypothetical protein